MPNYAKGYHPKPDAQGRVAIPIKVSVPVYDRVVKASGWLSGVANPADFAREGLLSKLRSTESDMAKAGDAKR